MSQNPLLKYTNLTIDDLNQLISDKLSSDSRFQNINNSSIISILLEIITGSIDLSNYNIERRAEENYLDTAKLKSSAILLSRNLGYVVQRPIPAETSLSMEIVGPLPGGLVAGNVLYLNRKSEFTLDGTPFVLKNTYQYTFTSSDISNGVGNSNFSKTISYGLVSDSSNYDLIVSASSLSAASVVDIVLMQGNIQSKTILGTDTDLINLIFQKYKIDDTSFSNIYSENDLGYDSDSDTYDQSQNFTRVAIDTFDVFAAEEAGTLTNYDSFYDINNRKLTNVRSTIVTSAVPVCYIKTSPDQNTIIEFGDNVFAKKGLTNTSQNIYIQYFSTLGKAANQIGVVGQKLQSSEQFLVNSIDITNNLNFTLKKNILGGADLEDIESIKANAPAIYSSLDRCVNKKDYIAYLRSLTSPINVKNAIAWGEQEETDSTNGAAIKKLFNIALFSVLGELYDVTSDIHQVRMSVGNSDSNVLSGAVLDDSYTPYILTPNNYVNVIVKESTIDQINENDQLTSTSKVKIVLNKLNTKSQMTVKNIYITPMIHEFDIVGTVKLRKLSNLNYIQKSINNKIYEYLNLNADFDTEVYKSKISEIIESDPNVVYTDFDFVPYNTSGVTFNYNSSSETVVDADISAWTPVGGETTEWIEIIYRNNIQDYLDTRTEYTFSDINTIFTSATTRTITKNWKNNFTERNFYNELCKGIYDDLRDLAGVDNGFADSVGFNNTVLKLRNSFDFMIKNDNIDSEGNISQFSMPVEIPKLRICLTYLYK